MAQGSWPAPGHNDRAVTDLEYERMAARFSDDGIYGSPADAAVVSAGTGLSVNIRPNVYGSLRGHAWTSGPDGDTINLSANISGQTRIDRIVLRLDRSDWTVRAVAKSGTPGGGVPSLAQSIGDTGTYEIALAEAQVLSGAGSVTVTRKELYVGTRHRPCTSSTRNPVPAVGEINFEVNTGRSVQWTGSSWRVLSDDSGEININSPLSAWTNNIDCILQRRNGVVCCRFGSMTRAAGNLSSGTESRLPIMIPSAYRHPTRDQYGLAMVSGEIARFIIYSANSDRPGQVWLTNKPTILTGQFLLPMSGMSWVV